MFQVDGISCSHAWSVLNKNRMLPEEYCSEFYKRGTILKTYEVPIYPLPDKGEWNIPEHIATEVVLPPKFKLPPGRPKKQREKSFSELSKRKGTILVVHVDNKVIIGVHVELQHEMHRNCYMTLLNCSCS